MRYLKLAVLIIGIICLQSLFSSYGKLFGITPDLLLIVVVIWGVWRGGVEGALLGFTLGLFQDIFSSTVYLHLISKTLVGFSAGILKENLYGDESYISMILVFGLTFLSLLIDGGLVYFLDRTLPGAPFLIPFSSLYNVLLTPLLYPLAKYFIPREEY